MGALLGEDSENAGFAISQPDFASTQQVKYSILANRYQENPAEADVHLTYKTPTGTPQVEVGDGWSQTFTFDQGDFLYLSAQNRTDGRITCSIEVKEALIFSFA